MYTLHFICLSVGGPLGCFYFLAVVSNAAMNMAIQICALVPALTSFEYIDHFLKNEVV